MSEPSSSQKTLYGLNHYLFHRAKDLYKDEQCEQMKNSGYSFTDIRKIAIDRANLFFECESTKLHKWLEENAFFKSPYDRFVIAMTKKGEDPDCLEEIWENLEDDDRQLY